jgi:hypothetical protein
MGNAFAPPGGLYNLFAGDISLIATSPNGNCFANNEYGRWKAPFIFPVITDPPPCPEEEEAQLAAACGLGGEAALVVPGVLWLRRRRRARATRA